MRKWGIVITAFYALILLAVLVPGAALLALKFDDWPVFFGDLGEVYRDWMLWIPIAIVVSGQALLLFLSVDTSHKRLKPRAHILISCVVGAILTALLTSAVIWSLGFAIRGDKFWENFLDKEINILGHSGPVSGYSGEFSSISTSEIRPSGLPG